MQAPTDNDLMRSVARGETEQLGVLFERYHRMLFSFFHNRQQQPEQSKDLVQLVFYRMLKYRHGFSGDGEFKKWMFHIARNVLYDAHKKQKRHTTDSVDDWQDQVIDQSPDWMQQQLDKERLDRLREALDQLPPDKKDILIQSKIKGQQYADIGLQLGCSEGAVKVKVFRALKALKAVYKNNPA